MKDTDEEGADLASRSGANVTTAWIGAAYEAGRVQGRLDTLNALQARLTKAMEAEAEDIRRDAHEVHQRRTTNPPR